jgi:hypothetical protein
MVAQLITEYRELEFGKLREGHTLSGIGDCAVHKLKFQELQFADECVLILMNVTLRLLLCLKLLL